MCFASRTERVERAFIKYYNAFSQTLVNIFPSWDIEGCDLAAFDIPARDNIHQYLSKINE